MVLTYGANIDDRLTKFVFDFVNKFAPARKPNNYIIGAYPASVDRYVFSIIEQDCVYVVLQGNIYNNFRTEEITVPNLARAFEEIYDVIIDDESYKYDIAKEELNYYKQRVKELIEEALLIEHNVFKIEDEDIEDILRKIVSKMVKVTKYYDKFMSQSIEVTSKIIRNMGDSFDIRFNIRFYNGGEENYNPTLHVDYHVDSKKDLLSNLQLIIDKTSKSFTDPSCGFVKLLTLVTKATIEDINKALNKTGFDNIINEDDIESMIVHNNGSLSDIARLCAVKGIVWALQGKSDNKDFAYLIE